MCECSGACLPGIVLFNYFIPELVYPGPRPSVLVPSSASAQDSVCACLWRACQELRRSPGPPDSSEICAQFKHDSLHVPSQTLTTHAPDMPSPPKIDHTFPSS